ncbi:M48 family metallopeptidase [Trinickia acidisoli]|uniref:M48 family metallopeptidase n=1 Tax=Trinickia acidisoli TaxID=2767482 RepID=UPI001A8D2600|nr:M48 family metallopeptidase [Trinickia acidisoli]
MSQLIGMLRHKNEKRYAFLMILFGWILWAAIAFWVSKYWNAPKTGHVVHTCVAYGVGILIFIWIMSAAYRASAFGNMVLVGPSQFPELHAMVVEGAREMGLHEPPRAFVYNSNGIFNAFARRLLGGRYVFLTSALVEANNDAQVRFVIGHEIGHHAAGHLNPWLNALKLPAHVVPFLARAYSRSREYTCDSIGAYLAKDAHASRSALQMLGCGCRRLNPQMNCDAFMAQEAMVPPIFGFLTEIYRTHPRLTRRVAAISAGVAGASRKGTSLYIRLVTAFVA